MKLSSALVLVNLTATAGFTTHQSTTFTAFDTIRYAAGQTDEVKGTGVWSAFELKRDKEENENDNAKEQKKDSDMKKK